MQNIFITKPYQFIPPFRSGWWTWTLSFYLHYHLRKTYGVTSHSLTDLHYLQESLAAGHSIMLAPNHCRPVDPFVMGLLVKATGKPVYAMASRHLFEGGLVQRLVLRMVGAYSIFRETTDREALRNTIDFLAEAERPVIIYPEGMITRANDRLAPLQDGIPFLARAAARKRASAKPPGKVVIHPLAVRYRFDGDLQAAVLPILREMETRLSWRHREELPIKERICRVGEGLLCLKEVEHLGQAKTGPVDDRIAALIEHLMRPIEEEWLRERPNEPLIERVKRVRQAIFPDIMEGKLDDAELKRRHGQLADTYLAIQLSCYPPGYLDGNPSKERLLETVERFEEDLTDVARPQPPMHVNIRVGPPIDVSPTKEKRGEGDPILRQIESQMRHMLFGDPLP